MKIAETIDLDDHDKVIDFLQNQSNRIEELEQHEKMLLKEIEDLQWLLQQNFNICRNRVVGLIDDIVTTIPKVYVFGSKYKSQQQIEQAYKDGYLRALSDLKKELIE